jgi:hypothetical protein
MMGGQGDHTGSAASNLKISWQRVSIWKAKTWSNKTAVSIFLYTVYFLYLFL